MERKYRKLTEEEIRNLSFDLRICFGICPWNISANIETVDDWIDIFWINYVDEEYNVKEYGMDLAKKHFENKKKWLIDIIDVILKIRKEK